jgi:pimeloyl-ACP methyl ester carboxylesterase
MTDFSLYTEERGDGFPLLCLHGHPGSARSMGVFAQQFGEARSNRSEFRVISPDLRGYGQSQCPGKFEITQHIEDLIRLLDDRGIEKAVVLGWSLGGIFAMELALRYPHRVSGLILIGTAARPWGNHPPISLMDNLFTGIAGILNILRPGWQWNIDQFGSRSVFRHLVRQQTPAVYKFLAREAVYAYFKTSRQADQALNRAIESGYNRVPDLKDLRCPTLMLIGEFDRHIAPAASLETAKAIGGCEWSLFDAAHLIPWECPESLLDRIEQWFSDHSEISKLVDAANEI